MVAAPSEKLDGREQPPTKAIGLKRVLRVTKPVFVSYDVEARVVGCIAREDRGAVVARAVIDGDYPEVAERLAQKSN